ncbi:MAG: transglutaminase-like cysteine peptidase [Roseiarcus sp.]|jgi:predicted transglutaminase-like cysteine proteinase
MVRYLAGLAAGAVIAIANISAASASPSAATMREGGYALAPFSFVKFCLDYPGDCPKSAGAGRIRLTSGRMAELASVNRAVNNSIRPTPDASTFRYWKLDVNAGDCNSFAVQKRHELIQRGWPAAALALTVAKTSWGEGHLVVTVRTDKGDLVLDNLRSNIVSWQRTGYDWIMRQSERNPQYWVELHGGQAGPVYAAADLDDATEVAEADDAPAAGEPVDGKLMVAAADAGSKPADAPRSPDVQSLEADAAAAALDEANKLAMALADIGWKRADAPRSPDVQILEADAATAALDLAKAQAAQAAIAELARWIADNRQAAIPVFDSVVAALDRLIEPSPATPAKPAEEEEKEANVADPSDPALFGFI